MSGLSVCIEGIRSSLLERLPHQRKTQREKLSVLVGAMLHVRSANVMELASGLPSRVARRDMRYQWISRFLANDLVCCDTVMRPFAADIIQHSIEAGKGLTLILDQSRVSERHQVLMLAIPYGERALPLAWRVRETEGGIGFDIQKDLLETVLAWLPADTKITLMGDRFYGTHHLIGWCQEQGWDYRLRLRGNLTVISGGEKTTTLQMAAAQIRCAEQVEITTKRIKTNIGIIQDTGHDEPWIIAMSAKPSYDTTLQYSTRWGIEPMFSDFKSRGFGLGETQLRYPDRVQRLILVMALALYWAVSTGLWEATHNQTTSEKKDPTSSPEKPGEDDYPGLPME